MHDVERQSTANQLLEPHHGCERTREIPIFREVTGDPLGTARCSVFFVIYERLLRAIVQARAKGSRRTAGE